MEKDFNLARPSQLPFFLIVPSLLFTSVVGIPFLPLPFLMIYFLKGVSWAFLSLAAHAGILFFVYGASASLLLVAITLIFSSLLLVGLHHFHEPKKSRVFDLWIVGLFAALNFFFLGLVELESIQKWMVELLGQFQSELVQTNPRFSADFFSSPEWKQVEFQFSQDMPSIFSSLSFWTLWLNLGLLLQLNPQKIRQKFKIPENFLDQWSSPESLIWPVLACAALLIFSEHRKINVFAFNFLKFFMSVYLVHGFLIFRLGWKKVGGGSFFQWAGSVLFLLFMMPFLVFLGLCDLWFDFRKKLRQS